MCPFSFRESLKHTKNANNWLKHLRTNLEFTKICIRFENSPFKIHSTCIFRVNKICSLAEQTNFDKIKTKPNFKMSNFF